MVETESAFSIFNIIKFSPLVPEAMILLSAVIFLMGGVFAADKKADRTFLFLGVLVLVFLFAMMAFMPLPYKRQEFFTHMFVVDAFSQVVKMMLVVSTVLVFLISDSWLTRGDNQRFEYQVLMLFSLLGMMLMVSANDLLSLYVGLELSSLPLYVLASFSRDTLKSTESGLPTFSSIRREAARASLSVLF